MRRFLILPAFLVSTVLADATPAHARGFARGNRSGGHRQVVVVQRPVVVQRQVVAVVRPRRPTLIQRGAAAVRGFGRGLLRGI